MITRIVLFMAVLMGWGCTPLVIQAKTAPVSLSFDGMILRLGTENPFLRPMDLEATAEREKAFQEAAYPNPEVSGSWGSSRSDGSSVRTSQVSFQQELDYSFRWLSRRSVAGARVIAAEAHAHAQRLELHRRAVSIFYTLQSLGVEKTVVDAKRRAAASLLARVEQDRAVGAAKTSEWRRTQTVSRLAEIEAIDVSRRIDAHSRRLAVLLGYPPGQRVVPSESMTFRPRNADLEKSLVNVLSRNPALRERRAEVEVARAQRNLAIKETFPTLRLEGFEERTEATRERRLGLSLTVPLWDRNGAARAEAGRRLELAEVELQNLENSLRVETEVAVEGILTALQKAKALQPGLAESDELIRNAELQFKEGRMNLSAFLDSLAAAYELKHTYLQSILEYEQGLLALSELLGDPSLFNDQGGMK
jgi:outer membrane protein TolC